MAVQKRSNKKAAFITGGILLILGLAAWLLYLNRDRLVPQVTDVTYLRVEMARDTALVRAGLRVQNYVPVPIRIDSVNYNIRNEGEKLGWGGQILGETLPPWGHKVLDFKLFLNTEKYRRHLLKQQARDSLDMDVLMTVYFDLPLMEPQEITLRRTVSTPVPKTPSFRIDTLFVKSFRPGKGYNFVLQLHAGNTSLPDLEIKELAYEFEFADNTIINGKADTTFFLGTGNFTVQVPIKLETAEVVELIRKKLSGKKKWPYHATISATVHSAHPLFDKLNFKVEKEGVFDAGSVSGQEMEMPSVKRIKSLELVQKEQKTYLRAAVTVKNPSPLPLYIDSARYSVRYHGKVVAQGAGNYEKKLPKNGVQDLAVELAVNNKQYQEMMREAKGQDKIPLTVTLDLIYDLPNHRRQQLSLKKRIAAPVPETGGLEVAGLEVKELDPEKGAHLLLKLRVKNNELAGLQLDALHYQLQLGTDIEIKGDTQTPIKVPKGVAEIEVPLELSANDVVLLIHRMLEGKQDWHYSFNGAVVVSSENGMLNRTKIALETSGELDPGTGGQKKVLPEIAKIDTLDLTIHYDTAWVKLHVQVKNPLPVTIHLQQLKLVLSYQGKMFGIVSEMKDHELPARETSSGWLTLAVNYKAWSEFVKNNQELDSVHLKMDLLLNLGLGQLDIPPVNRVLEPTISMPYYPVAIVEKIKLAGISFRNGIKLNIRALAQNANVKGLQAQDLSYKVVLDNGVDVCGTVNRTYTISLHDSRVEIPVSLSLPEALKMLTRQLFGPPTIHYKANASATVITAEPEMKSVHFIFENHNVSNLKKKKTPSPRLKKQQQQNAPATANK